MYIYIYIYVYIVVPFCWVSETCAAPPAAPPISMFSEHFEQIEVFLTNKASAHMNQHVYEGCLRQHRRQRRRQRHRQRHGQRHGQHNPESGSTAPNLSTNIIPTKIAGLKLSGKSSVDKGIQPLQIQIMLKSYPLKSAMLVRRLAELV